MEQFIVNGVLTLGKIEKEIGGKMGTAIAFVLMAIVMILTFAAMFGCLVIGFKVCNSILYYFTGYTIV